MKCIRVLRTSVDGSGKKKIISPRTEALLILYTRRVPTSNDAPPRFPGASHDKADRPRPGPFNYALADYLRMTFANRN